MKMFFTEKEQKELAELPIDNGTTTITIPTPKGWKCKRCKLKVKHRHTTYESLTLPQPINK